MYGGENLSIIGELVNGYPGKYVVNYWHQAILNPGNGTFGGSTIGFIEGFGDGFNDVLPGFMTERDSRAPHNPIDYARANRGLTGNDADHHAIAVRQAGNVGHYFGGALGGYVTSAWAAHAATLSEAFFPSTDWREDIEANYQGVWDFMLNRQYPEEVAP